MYPVCRKEINKDWDQSKKLPKLISRKNCFNLENKLKNPVGCCVVPSKQHNRTTQVSGACAGKLSSDLKQNRHFAQYHPHTSDK